jgi:hypothetical protein
VSFKRLVLTAVLTALSMALLAATASATTYYLSSTGCNDTYAGTSSTDTSTNGPWCSLSKATAATIRAGDSILLNRGSSWTGQYMSFTAAGSSVSHITLGAYGVGNRPIIRGTNRDTERMITLRNPDWWDIRDLEVSDAGAGIVLYFGSLGHEGFTFDNIYVHDIYGIWVGHTVAYPPPSGDPTGPPYDPAALADAVIMSTGILFTGDNTLTPRSTEWLARGITMSNIEGTGNVDSIAFDAFRWPPDLVNLGDTWFRDIVLKNLYLHDDDGNGIFARLGCSDSLRFIGVTNATVIDSNLDNEASCYTRYGTAAIIVGRTRDISIVNSVLTDTPNTGSPDQTAFDLEYAFENTTISHSYVAGNAGAGIEVLNTCACAIAKSINSQFNGNLFENNGLARGITVGSVYVGGTSTATARNNLFYDVIPTFLSSTSAGITGSNNTRMRATGYYGANGFSGTQGTNQWRYQYRPAGGSWRDLPRYDSTNRWWYQSTGTPSDQRVRQFNMSPGSCARCDVARVWVSPVPAYVHIRGQLLKSALGGDGAVARINKVTSGGAVTQLWPASGDYALGASDQVGTATDLDNVFVAAGDSIRFEIGSGASGSATSDEISWSNAVGVNELLTAEWNFNAAGNAEGWRATNLTQSVSGGANNLGTFTTTDPYIRSPDSLGIDASIHKYVKVRIRNNTTSDLAQLYYTTNADTTWNETKSQMRVITTSDGAYREYVFNFSQDPNWTGTIRQIRFDPAITTTGSVDLDWLRFYATTPETFAPAPNNGFNTAGDTELWRNQSGSTQSVAGGVNTVTTTANDAYILSSASLDADAGTYRYLKIRLRNNTASTTAKVSFTTTADQTFDAAKSVTFPVRPRDTDYREYVIDMGANVLWSNQGRQLRFHPATSATGTADIDYIRLSATP